MSGRFLVDTNIIIAVFAGDPAVLMRMDAAEEVFVPTVALGELYYGAQKSGRRQKNMTRIEEFVSSSVVLGIDLATAREYGRIKNDLREQGKPIPENDIWIAAVAKRHDLTLVSRDQHFFEVSSISIDSW